MGMGFKLDNINEELVKSLKDIIVYVDVSNWVESGDGTYTNTITVDGISTLSNPVMGVSYLSGTRTTTEDAAYALLLGGTTSTNTITLIASALPSISFNIVLKGCTGAGEITMGNFNELVSKVTSLETSVSSINTNFNELVSKVTSLETSVSSINTDLISTTFKDITTTINMVSGAVKFSKTKNTVRISVTNATIQELGTKAAYGTIGTLPVEARPKRDIIKRIILNSTYYGQFVVRAATGLVLIGYTSYLSDGSSTDIASGATILIDETFQL